MKSPQRGSDGFTQRWLDSSQENTYCQQKGPRKHGKPLRMLHISNRRQSTCDFSYLLFLSYSPDISYMCTLFYVNVPKLFNNNKPDTS